ncbi:MAG: T9SS type A sorting domain-containing protein [Flavobacterium sp.]
MKKLLLLAIIAPFSFANAQLLQSEDFNALTLGNVGTDITGATAGQDEWFTQSTNGTAPTTGTNADNSNFQIVAAGNESTNGLKIVGSNGNKGSRFMWKDGFADIWDARDLGNDIIEIEYDMFTGPVTTSKVQYGIRLYGSDGATTRTLNGYIYNADTRVLAGVAYLNNAGTYNTYVITLTTGGLILDANTWYRIGFAYDTNTGETIWKASTVYTGLPEENWAVSSAFPPAEFDFVSGTPTTNTAVSEVVFDNITARATPEENLLGVKSVVATAKNISVYPNPAMTVVNFSSEINTVFNKVEMADMNGRVVKTAVINATEGQVSVNDLAAGVYMVKITTDSGVVTKKIVKQ